VTRLLTARDRAIEARYGTSHKKTRQELEPLVLGGGVRCWRCGEPIRPGEPWDLGHVDGDPSRYAGPEHRACNRATTGRLPAGWQPAEEEPEREGLAASDQRFRVPWLKGLRRVPRDATWPRLMTVPHPAAVGSYGKEFCRWAERRSGRPLRWWQQLSAARMLEHDDQGLLVWDAVLLSLARQLGKSWLLRELCLWRIEQGDRFGEEQNVLHTGKDLAVCIEVQRSARIWAKPQPGLYLVREANGQERIEYLGEPGGRWLVKAKDAPYGFSVSKAVVDEAWNVEPRHIEEGVAPTMVERVSPQLLLVSTAHRLATTLMLTRRRAALEQLETGAGDLLIEWSAPRGAPVDDLRSWRLASPHWTPHREKLIGRRLEAMYAGETQDVTETDPAESFRAQWLNQWPRGLTVLEGQELLAPGDWARLAAAGLQSSSPLFVAIEDNYGNGAAVAAAALLDDGRIEVDGWVRDDWDSAVEDVRLLGTVRRIRHLQVGASMLNRMPPGTVPTPRTAGGSETRPGLALIRDLVAGGQIAHDTSTAVLDQAVGQARVKEGTNGLILLNHGPTHLVRALAWAVSAAHKPAPEPVIS
jgi:hypothetical protein